MPTNSLPRRILAGIAGSLLLSACPQLPGYNCSLSHCPTSDYEVYFTDTLYWRRIDTLGTAGLHIAFDQVFKAASAPASAQQDCEGCSGFFLLDSAVLAADRPIVSPEGDTVPAGTNLLAQPWKDKVGRGDIYFRFHPGVRFESGRYAFAITTPWEFEGTRVILGDTSYLVVP